MSEVKIAVLLNGEKLIGKFEEEDEVGLKVSESFILKEALTEQGMSIIPIPFVQTSDTHIYINPDGLLVWPFNPDKELYNMYMQMTSNILIPKSNSGIKLVK